MNVIAIDVGTSSVRLAIVAFDGPHLNNVNVLANQTKAITVHKNGSCYEQYSDEIWQAICDCSNKCLEAANLSGEYVHSIAFSATCSMVIVGELNENISTSNLESLSSTIPRTSASSPDVIMWMDHRAVQEASDITKNYRKLCEQFGGAASPEFSLSKLLWLHKHEPSRFTSAVGFMELPDWLAYKCTGDDIEESPRSLCSVTCKWGYDPIEGKWPEKLFRDRNMADLGKGDFSRIGKIIGRPGQKAGNLSLEAAIQLGIVKKKPINGYKERLELPDITVGVSLIDAHAGMLAMLSVPLEGSNIESDIQSTFCFLAGTSTCHMLLSKERLCTKGIWGPYYGAILDKLYLREAGQSLTGKLIEHTIETHQDGKELLKTMDMNAVIEQINRNVQETGSQNSLHIVPSFHGNRSPLANPNLKGGIYGLSVDREATLEEVYSATIEALAYETRLIKETLKTNVQRILVSGGLMNNPIYMQTMADVLSCDVLKLCLPKVDFMVMGAALVARNASKDAVLVDENLKGLKYSQLIATTYHPDDNKLEYHEKKYKCYKEFAQFSLKVDEIMNEKNATS